MTTRPGGVAATWLRLTRDAHGLLPGPVQMGVERLDAGPFEEPHHVPGGQHPGHLLELRGLGEEVGHRLGVRHLKLKFELEAGL